MKKRLGFVSNSSSSSFIAVCTKYDIEDVLLKMGFKSDDIEMGMAFYGNIVVLAYDWDNPFAYGIDIAQDLERGERVPDLKEKFRKIVKERFGIDIPIKDVEFKYGEVGSG